MAHIRKAHLEELGALSELCMRSKAHWGYDADFMAACVDELTLTPDDLARDAVIVLEEAGRPVGVAQVHDEGTYADLMKLFVEPGVMGRGYGAQLMRWALATARALRHGRLMIEADPDAVAFYARFGAWKVGKVASGSIPGRSLPLMQIDLT